MIPHMSTSFLPVPASQSAGPSQPSISTAGPASPSSTSVSPTSKPRDSQYPTAAAFKRKFQFQPARTGLLTLPFELIDTIADHLSPQDRAALGTVDPYLVGPLAAKFRFAEVDGADLERYIGFYEQCTNLKKLFFSGDTLAEADLSRLKRLTKLEELNVEVSNIASLRSLKELKELNDLRKLTIECPDTAVDIGAIAGMRLDELNLSQSVIDERGLSSLPSIPLKKLVLVECGDADGGFGISEDNLIAIGQHPTLEEVDLELTELAIEGLAHLVNMPNLRKLNVGGTVIYEEHMSLLIQMEQLNELTMNNLEAALGPLVGKQGKPLKALHLNNTLGLHDGNLEQIGRMGELQELNLSIAEDADIEDEDEGAQSFGDVGLTHLGNNKKLEVLDLSGRTSITGGKVAEIVQQMPNLKSLKLAGCTGVDDEVIVGIERLSQLEEVHIDGTRISEGGVERLKNMQRPDDMPPLKVVYMMPD